MDHRQLSIYAIPLIKDKLVFLPVCGWRSEPAKADSESDPAAVALLWGRWPGGGVFCQWQLIVDFNC